MAARLGFIGAGNMAEALMRGVIARELYAPADIIASEIFEGRRDYISSSLAVNVTADNAEVVKTSDVVILALKPQHLAAALASIEDSFRDDQLVISIAAGITLDSLAKMIPKARLVRVMPNQPCMSMASASAFSSGRGVEKDDLATVREILEAVGVAHQVEENLLDAVTGLSGSGPAYAYLVIEALADGGVLMGLPRDVAQSLAAQTLLGAAKTVLDTGEHPGRLKDMVCSPGGTTIEAMKVLEDAGVRAAMIGAVRASAEKSRQLGE